LAVIGETNLQTVKLHSY